MTPNGLLDALWSDYVTATPQAERIHHLLSAGGEPVHHDQVAVWTYAAPGIGIDALASVFEDLGWQAGERQRFESQLVRTQAWTHSDPDLPDLLIVELEVVRLSPRAQEIIAGLVAQLPARFVRSGLERAGRPWQLTHADYETLRAENEHAAWVAAFGPHAHHFTVDVSALDTFPDLVALDAFLIEHGFPLDEEMTDASTTPAELVEVAFADETARIPSGTYEMVLRARRARQRREEVVELEQHVDVDTDELHTHAVDRGPSHHRG